MRRLSLPVVVALGAAILGGCHGCGQEPEEPESARPRASTGPSAASSAVIEGTIRLAEGAELPGWPENPMTPPTPRPSLPDACTPADDSDRFPVRRAPGNALAGVLVTLSDFQSEPPHEPITHEVTITDCRLTPSIVVATRGDHLRITNQTDYPFVPDLGLGVMQALLHEHSRDLDLVRGGVRTLQCGFAASCGRTEVVTLYHPLHAVTDENGHYRIENVPANDELRVSAWHPLFRDQGETVTLAPGATQTVDIALMPAPPREPEPEEPPVDPSILH